MIRKNCVPGFSNNPVISNDRFAPSNGLELGLLKTTYKQQFLNASKYCGSVLKNEFVAVVVGVGVANELLSYFQRI